MGPTRAPRHRVPTYSAAQVRAAEAPLLAAGEPLMARASAALAAVVGEVLDESAPRPERMLVLCGGGDNGGDALFAAAILAEREGLAADLLALSDHVHPTGLEAAVAAGARLVPLDRGRAVEYGLVLDGILGIGAARSSSPGGSALRGPARAAVEALLPVVRSGRTRVVAVDLPSGLHPDTGVADEAVLPAVLTATFGAVKHGLVTGSGPRLAGEVVLVDIGIGPGLAGAAPLGETDVAVRWTAGDPRGRSGPEGDQR